MTKIEEIIRSNCTVDLDENLSNDLQDDNTLLFTSSDMYNAMVEYADYRVKQVLDLIVDSVSINVYDIEDDDKPEDYIYVDQRCVAINYNSILNIKQPKHD